MHYYADQGIIYGDIVARLNERPDEDCHVCMLILTNNGRAKDTMEKLWLLAQAHRNSRVVCCIVEPEFQQVFNTETMSCAKRNRSLEVNALAVEWFVRKAWRKLNLCN